MQIAKAHEATMCFSAEASYSAAAVIGLVGVATIARTPKSNRLALACIPLLFAIQQFAEGVVWTSLRIQQPDIGTIAAYSFLFVAFIVWPIAIPLALLIAEDAPLRRALLAFFLAVGSGLALFGLYTACGNEISFSSEHGHIAYSLNSPLSISYHTFNAIYTVVVVTPSLISTLRYMWIFGLLIFFFWAAALIVFMTTFASVWCFFSAILSIFLYRVVTAK